MIRLLGAILVTVGGAASGLGLAWQVKRTQRQLGGLITAVEQLQNELQFRLLPVGQLFAVLGRTAEGEVGRLFQLAADKMAADPALAALQAVQRAMDELPALSLGQEGRQTLLELASSLGRYDLEGQCRAIALAQRRLTMQYDRLCAEKSGRCRSYGVLGVCTGLALAIILI